MPIRSRHCRTSLSGYALGPTACVAHPSVVNNIRHQIEQESILSLADARLATRSGMLQIPPIERSGFNDGVIYPPEIPRPAQRFEALESGAASRASEAPTAHPTGMFSLRAPGGALHCLVLLVDFHDNEGTESPSHFDDLLFNEHNPNSMRSYYRDLSFGKLDVTGTVTEWIRADHGYRHYTNNASGTSREFPRNTPGLLNETIRKYLQNDDFSEFDVNGDGFIDGLFLVHAGAGAETEADETLRKHMIWSHKWTLPDAIESAGVSAYAYFTAPEDGRLGVFSHEFGHFLGLPDLYDTSYRSRGIGDWCLMAGGSWGGGGNSPTRLSAWCLAELDWIQPNNVKMSTALALDTLENNMGDCYRLWSGGQSSTEYFLIENRQMAGRDAELPGSGLAVWHIDETQSDNANPLAFKVALVQADGRRDLEFNRNAGDDGDVFPGSLNVSKLDSNSNNHPHTRKNDGTATTVALSNISVLGSKINVDVKV